MKYWIGGALVLLGLCLLPPAPTRSALADAPAIVINELQYHPASDNHGEEYIEIYNAGPTTVDLSHWAFSDGIDYTFMTGTTMLPGEYLVIGHDPAVVQAVYGIQGVLGPFTDGRLANSGERVALEDAFGFLVDEVTYDDHIPWSEAADGDGPSLELINPTFDNDSPCSWSASVGLGTPGMQNSTFLDGNIPPCVIAAEHTPSIPRSNQAITVTVWVQDNQSVIAVSLSYRWQGQLEYQTTPMFDDGSDGDAVVGDAIYTAVLSPLSPSGTMFSQPGEGIYLEFFITATDNESASRIVPDGAPGAISAETGLPQTLSYLAWVEDIAPIGALPIYRLTMTDQNQAELETRDLYSNELLDAMFIYEGEVFYNVGVRYRGETSRPELPHPYRIKFRDAQEFQDRERINLISDHIDREAMAYDLFQRAGLPASDTRFVSLLMNGAWAGDYLDVEQVDRDFLKAHFGEDNDGNLYRGIEYADLMYRGPDPEAYRPYYEKKTNEDADDYTDIISLTNRLTNTPDASFVSETDKIADMRQWLNWFAVHAVLDNHEGALWLGQGDDYFLYHRELDDRFILISWDHDATFLFPDHTIWEPDWYAGEIVRRILHTPVFTRWYYQGVADLIEGPFSVAEMFPRIDALPDVVSAGDKQELKDYVAARISYLWDAEIPKTTLSISTNGGHDIVTTQDSVTLEGDCSPLRDVSVNGGFDGIVYPTATTWRYEGLLPTRDNIFTVADGQDTRTITVFRDLFHGGVLTQDTTLVTSLLPYTIREDILLSGAVTLTIQPGATLQFEPDRVLRVLHGARLLAEGTWENPIHFVGRDGSFWGGILLYDTHADNRIAHAVLESIHEVIETPRTHGVTAYGATITVENSIIRHTRHSNAIIASSESNLYLLNNHIYDIGSDAVHATGGYALIQGNRIHDTVYDASWNPSPPEGIEISHMDTPAVILDNTIYNVTDDCLDLNHASAVIARNVLHDCGDKGISVGHPSSTTLVNNLVYGCWGNADDPDYTGFGIALKDGALSQLVNNTVADNRHGIGLYEMHAGAGAATATMTNMIVWANQQNLDVRDGASLSVRYSTISGGWPGEGNLASDPQFRSPQHGDYRLRENSPSVDSGTSQDAPSVDIQGIPRPKGAGVDRGAYEFFEFFSTFLPVIVRH